MSRSSAARSSLRPPSVLGLLADFLNEAWADYVYAFKVCSSNHVISIMGVGDAKNKMVRIISCS